MSGRQSRTQTPEATSGRSSRSSRRGSQQSGNAEGVGNQQDLNPDEIQQLAEDNLVDIEVEANVNIENPPAIPDPDPQPPPAPELPRRSSRIRSKKNQEAGSRASSREASVDSTSSQTKKKTNKEGATPKSALKKTVEGTKHGTVPKGKQKSIKESPEIPLESVYPEFAVLKNTPFWELSQILVATLQTLQHSAHNRTTEEKEDFLQRHLDTERILKATKRLADAYAPTEEATEKAEQRIATRLVSELLMKTQTLKQEFNLPFENYWDKTTHSWDDFERARLPKEFFDPYVKLMKEKFKDLQLSDGKLFRQFFEKLLEIDDAIKISPKQVCVLTDLCFNDQSSRIFKNLKRTFDVTHRNIEKQHPVFMALKELMDMLPKRTVLKVELTNDFMSFTITPRQLAPDLIDSTLTTLYALARDAFPTMPSTELCSMIKLKLLMTLPKEMRLLLITQEERRRQYKLDYEDVESLYAHLRFWSGRVNRNFRGYDTSNIYECYLYDDCEYGAFQISCRERNIPFTVPEKDVVVEGKLAPPVEESLPPAPVCTAPSEPDAWQQDIREILRQNQSLIQSQAQTQTAMAQQQAQFFQRMFQSQVPSEAPVFQEPAALPALPAPPSVHEEEEPEGKKKKKQPAKKGKVAEQLQANDVSASSPEGPPVSTKLKIYKPAPKNATGRQITQKDPNFALHQRQFYDMYKQFPFNDVVEENLRILKMTPWYTNNKGKRQRNEFGKYTADVESIPKAVPIYFKKGNQIYLAKPLLQFYKERGVALCCGSRSCNQKSCEAQPTNNHMLCESCYSSWHVPSLCCTTPKPQTSS